MKQNYDIQKNPPSLKKEDIVKHKDFDALLTEFQKNAISNTPNKHKGTLRLVKTVSFLKYAWIAAATVGVGSSVYIIQQKNNTLDSTVQMPSSQEKNKAQTTTIQPIAMPAIPTNKVNTYYLNMDKNDTLRLANGASLIALSGALIDDKGQQIKGKVKLMVTDYQDITDWASLQNTFDAKDIQGLSVKNGLDIEAVQNGQKLQMRTDKAFILEYPVENPLKNTSLFTYNKLEKKWLKSAMAETRTRVEIVTKTDTIEEYSPQKGNTELVEPIKPKKANPANQQFELDVVKKEFPEVAAYNTISWEVSPENKNFDPASYKEVWSNVKLEKNKETGDYVLFLSKGAKVLRLKVYPVFTEDKYTEQLAIYEEEYKKYKAKLSPTVKKIGRTKQETIKTPIIQFRLEQLGTNLIAKGDALLEEILVKLEDETGETIREHSKILVADKELNFVYSFENTYILKLRKDSEKIIWTFLPENKIAYTRIKNIPSDGILKMSILPDISKMKSHLFDFK